MKKYRHLLFDADDTLFDFKKGEHEAFHMTCTAVNLPFSEEIYNVYTGINDVLWKLLETGGITLPELKLARFRQFLEAVHPYREDLAETAARMRDLYIEFLGEQAFLLPGAIETTTALAEKYDLYIITNGISRIQRARIGKTPFPEIVKDIFVSEEIGAAKPSAAYFDHVLAKIGDPHRSDYLVIGDSLSSDIRGAIAYGLDCCWFNPKHGETDLPVNYQISTLAEISELLL